MRRAAELHVLTLENRRLVEDLRDANLFLAAVMDRLRTGAIAIDAEGVVRAVNQPAKAFIGIEGDIVGQTLGTVMEREDLAEPLAARAYPHRGVGRLVRGDRSRGVGAGHRIWSRSSPSRTRTTPTSAV